MIEGNHLGVGRNPSLLWFPSCCLTTRWSPGSTPGQADPASSAILHEGGWAGPLSSRPLAVRERARRE